MIEIKREKEYVNYAYDILEGKIPACQYVKSACRRFLDNFERDDLTFRYDIVDRVIAFAGCLKHFNSPDPAMNGRYITLSDWQMFIVANIFGFWVKKDGSRLYHTGYIEVSRKGAKTMLMAIIGLYQMISDPNNAQQILLCANSREQAGRLYEYIQNFCIQLDPKQKDLIVMRDRVKVKASGAFCLTLSSDSKRSDGYLPTIGIIDEGHEMKDTGNYDVLRSGAVSKLSFIGIITTSGFNQDGPCYQIRQDSIDVVTNIKQDDRHFVLIYTLDKDDDWKNRDCWLKSQPNLGKSVSWEFYDMEFQAALNSGFQERNFRVKNLNTWVATENVWIPDSYIRDVMAPVDMSKWSDCYVFCGLDCGAVHDITAVTYLCYRQDIKKFEFYSDCYLPEACLKEGENKEYYSRMARDGFLRTTPGNVTDYDTIHNDILEKQRKYGFLIFMVGYDQWNATQLAINLQNSSVRMQPISQALGAMNKGTKTLEKLIYAKECIIDKNPVVRTMFQSCQLKVDWNGNAKPNKAVTTSGSNIVSKKIDAVIAMINALIALMDYGKRIYNFNDTGSDDEDEDED